MINLKIILFEGKEMRQIMIKFYLSQKKYNKKFHDLNHFAEFLMEIVSVNASEKVTFEKIYSRPF